jgi:hypothetical protein
VTGKSRACTEEAELVAILSQIGTNERPALKQLYDRFGARLYGVAHRILRDPSLAEDALQEAFVKIWRNAGKFDPARGSAIGWVVIIVRRAAFDLRPRDLPAASIEIADEQPENGSHRSSRPDGAGRSSAFVLPWRLPPCTSPAIGEVWRFPLRRGAASSSRTAAADEGDIHAR